MIFGKNEDVQKPRGRKEEPEADWDFKRIAIGLIVLGVLLIVVFEGKRYFLDKNPQVLEESVKSEIKKPDINPPNFNVSSNLVPKLGDIKKTVESLDVAEVASSSPQIQKVLNDIKGIQNLPANQAREMCLKICSGI